MALRPRQNGRHFPDDILKCTFLDENVRIYTRIPLKFVFKVPTDNKPASLGAKPISELIVAYFTDAYMRHSASVS